MFSQIQTGNRCIYILDEILHSSVFAYPLRRPLLLFLFLLFLLLLLVVQEPLNYLPRLDIYIYISGSVRNMPNDFFLFLLDK